MTSRDKSCSLGFAIISVLLTAHVPGVGAQEAPTAAPQPQANWASSCSATSRVVPLSCTLEQRIVLRNTGQQVARIAVQTSGPEPRTPGLLVHLPLGLSISAGASLSIDGGPPRQLPIQTCDSNGCYAASTVDADLLAALQGGHNLRLTFADVQTKPMSVEIKLDGFTKAFAGVK